MDTKLHLLIIGLFYGIAVANPDIQESLQNLNINGIPSDFDQTLNNLTNSIKQEDVENELKKKCRENSGGEEAYEKAKETMMETQKCLTDILDYEKIQREIELAKPKGDLDVVFKKYCMQTPTIKKCVYNAANSIEPCLQAGEIETKNTGINVTDSLIDFVCHKDGDRIALFIAEGGPDCVNSSLPAIRSCVETHMNLTMGDEMPSLQSLPLLMLNTEECEKFVGLQRCIVKTMDDCPETTPGNVVESLFNFIKKHTPCKGYQSPLAAGRGAASATYTTFHFLFLSFLTGLAVVLNR